MASRGRGRGKKRNDDAPSVPGASSSAEVAEVAEELGSVDLRKPSDSPPGQIFLPVRPGVGSRGIPIQLIANHFELKLNKQIQVSDLIAALSGLTMVWTYDVKMYRVWDDDGRIGTSQFNRRNAHRLFWGFVVANSGDFPNHGRPPGERRMGFDSQNLLFSLEPLKGADLRFEMQLEQADAWVEFRAGKYVLELKETEGGAKDISDAAAVYEPDLLRRDRSVIQMLEVLMSENIKHNDVFFPSGRSFLYHQRANNPHFVDLGSGRELCRGFYASTRVVDGWKLMLNLDVKATPHYKAIPVVNYVMEVLGLRQPPTTLNPMQIAELNKNMKGLKLKCSHNGHSLNCDRIIPKTARTYKFLLVHGNAEPVDKTIEEYMRESHGITLEFPDWPLVQKRGGQKQTCFPLELCSIYPGQKLPNRKLTPREHQTIIGATVVDPAVRLARIKEAARDAQIQVNAQLIDVSLSLELVRLPGRVLPHPQIEYNGQKTLVVRDGKWNMGHQNIKFLLGGRVQKWVCLSMADPQQLGELPILEFCKRLAGAGYNMGVDMNQLSGQPQHIPVDRRNPAVAQNALRKAFQDAHRAMPDLDYVLVILDEENSPYKGFINLLADHEFGIPNGCVQPKKVQSVLSPRGNVQYLSNVLMKINAKTGGVNQHMGLVGSSISPSVKELFMNKEATMFVGADVSHPEGGDRGTPSIVGVTATIDLRPSRYVGFERLQPSRQETIEGLTEMVRLSLVAFYKSAQAKPSRIVFYRDGVGEGHFRKIIETEIRAVRLACLAIQKDGGYKPPLTFIVVQKRHNTRLFKKDVEKIPASERGGTKNIPPGTTVDTVITHPREHDFYLCSHEGIQGTSKPTHYHVLWDDAEMGADELQELTFVLCHSYARCTRSVSLPPPVYYAHLIAARAALRLKHVIGSSESDSSSETELSSVQIQELQSRIEVHQKLKDSKCMYWL